MSSLPLQAEAGARFAARAAWHPLEVVFWAVKVNEI